MKANSNLNDGIKESFHLPKSYNHRNFGGSLSISATPYPDFETLERHEGKVTNRKSKKEVVSSAHGKIRAILVAYPYYSESFELAKTTLYNLIQQLGPGVDIYIFTASGVDKDLLNNTLTEELSTYEQDLKAILEKFNKHNTIHLLVPKNFDQFSRWVRDPFLVASDDQSNEIDLIEPNLFVRNTAYGDASSIYEESIGSIDLNDAMMADHIKFIQRRVSYPLVADCTPSPLIFHGGNILVGDTFILIGADAFEKIKTAREQFYVKAVEDFADALFREKSIGEFNPDKHPLYNAVINNRSSFKILSSDEMVIKQQFQDFLSPKYRKRIIKLNLPAPPLFKLQESINCGGNQYKTDWLKKIIGQHQPYIHLDLFLTLLGRSEAEQPYQIFLPQLIDASDLNCPELEEKIIAPLNQWFRQIEACPDLEGFDFQYIRTPLTYFKTHNGEYHWCTFSYNNCLVEVTKNYRKVWLPSYSGTSNNQDKEVYGKHLEAFNEEAREVFERQGIEVVMLGNYTLHMLQAGSVHCMTNYLYRLPDDQLASSVSIA